MNTSGAPRLTRAGLDPCCEGGKAGPGQFRERGRASGHGHQQCLTRALDCGALAGGPGQIGRREGEPAQAFGGADGWGPGREPQRRQHPLGGDLAEDAQCAADVLVVNESISERDPAAEKGGQSSRLQVIPRPGEQVLRAVVGVGGHPAGAAAVPVESRCGEPAQEPDQAQVLVAVGVRDHVADPP